MNNCEYLSFSGDEFRGFVSFAKMMSSKSKSNSSKTTSLHVENNSLVCRYMNDSFSMVEFSVPLEHTDNVINDAISVSIQDLFTLIKSSAALDKFVIRKSFNQFEFNIVGGGWIPFRTSTCDLTKYNISDDRNNIGNINSSKLKSAINSVANYTQEYTYARDKYIRFNKNQMTATSRLSGVVISDEFVDMVLHRDDAILLKTLLKGDYTLDVFKVNDNNAKKIMFVGPKFKFVTIDSCVDHGEITYNKNISNYITVDCNELYKLVSFSEEYSASKHVVGMSIKNSALNVSVKNVLASNHNSVINSTIIGDVKDTSKEYEIPSKNLLKALKLFQDKRVSSVNIYLSDESIDSHNSIIVFNNATQAIINILSR